MTRAAWLILLGLGLLVPVNARGKVRSRRTLKRTLDTVVLKADVLGEKILGVHKNRLRVYACRAGFMVPITYPGVKLGEERLRVNITRGHSQEDMDLALDLLKTYGEAFFILSGEELGPMEDDDD